MGGVLKLLLQGPVRKYLAGLLLAGQFRPALAVLRQQAVFPEDLLVTPPLCCQLFLHALAVHRYLCQLTLRGFEGSLQLFNGLLLLAVPLLGLGELFPELLPLLLESLDDLSLQRLFCFKVSQQNSELLPAGVEVVVGVDHLLHLIGEGALKRAEGCQQVVDVVQHFLITDELAVEG